MATKKLTKKPTKKRKQAPNWAFTLHQFVPTPGDELWCKLCGGVEIIWLHQLPQEQ